MIGSAGGGWLTLEATVKGLVCAWYDPTQVDNIFGFIKLKIKHIITYDSDK